MAISAKTKKSATKASAKRLVTPKKAVAARPRPVRQSVEAVPTLELRVILLVTLFIALCILFIQIYIRNS